MKELRGRTAVITGAASGIGRAFAERLVREGMKLVLADVDAGALDAAAKAMEQAGAEVLAVPTDVSRGDEVERLAARAEERFGAVHLVCNNAGVGGSGGPIWTLSENDWRWTLGVNLWGVIHGVRVFVPRLLAHGQEAHVINTASIAGLVAPPFLGAYVASKHAVVALSEVLVKDLQATGAKVGVSVLCPGWVRTGIAESERHRPSEFADAGAGAGRPNPAMEMVKKLVAGGTDPAVIADVLVEAVRANSFYVLPHPQLKPAIEDRFADLRDGRTPRFDPKVFGG